jgi:aldehyde dehydrogenase family 7 member A1
MKLIAEVLERNHIPGAVAGLVIGGRNAGKAVADSEHFDMGM